MKPETTLIYLHSLDPFNYSSVGFDKMGKMLVNAEISGNIIVLVPSHEVSLFEVSLPKMPRKKLLDAISFALEEQFIEDISLLHFALATKEKNNDYAVSVVAKQKMDLWLQKLHQEKIYPTAIVPALFTLPFDNKNWYINYFAGSTNFRNGKNKGFGCDNNLSAWLDLKIKEETLPEHIYYYEYGAGQAVQEIENITLVKFNFSSEQFYIDAYKNLTKNSYINLLQQEYAPKREVQYSKKMWSYAGSFFVLWISLVFFNQIISYFILNHENKNLLSEKNKIVTKYFASNNVSENLLRQKLKNILAKNNDNNFLRPLGLVAEYQSQHKSLHVTQVDYSHEKLQIKLKADNFSELNALAEILHDRGFKVEQKNSELKSDGVVSTMIVEKNFNSELI